MPATIEQWKKFDVIILGDLDSSFLAKPQQSAIEQAVSEGAGLLMIGGQNNFGPGGYKDSPIEKALPVLVGELAAAQEKNEFIPQLTAEGLTHPAMEGLSRLVHRRPAAASRAAISRTLRGNVVVAKRQERRRDPAHSPRKTGPDGKPGIVLAIQRYGKGRSAAFTADTT